MTQTAYLRLNQLAAMYQLQLWNGSYLMFLYLPLQDKISHI